LWWTRGSGSYQRGPFGRCSCCSTTATGRAFEATVRTSRPDIVRRGELGCHVDATRGIDDGVGLRPAVQRGRHEGGRAHAKVVISV